MRVPQRFGLILAMLWCLAVQAQDAFPTGSFAGGPLTATFNKDGTHVVSENGRVVLSGTYTIQTDQIVLTDKAGESTCTDTGTYQWRFDGTSLTFRAVLDNCSPRVDSLTRQKWIRK